MILLVLMFGTLNSTRISVSPQKQLPYFSAEKEMKGVAARNSLTLQGKTLSNDSKPNTHNKTNLKGMTSTCTSEKDIYTCLLSYKNWHMDASPNTKTNHYQNHYWPRFSSSILISCHFKHNKFVSTGSNLHSTSEIRMRTKYKGSINVHLTL